MEPLRRMTDDRSPEPQIRAWKPNVPGIREVFHARFWNHAYPLHTHDVWTLFIVDEGAIRFELGRRERVAAGAMVGALPPHVVHDGRPATDDGFRKRVLYVETSALGEEFTGAAVDRPSIEDGLLRQRIAELNDALECVDDRLEAETRFAFVAERIRSALGGTSTGAQAASGDGALAESLRAFLDAHVDRPATMADAARSLDAGVTQIARAFTRRFGIAPHAYLDGRRVEVARDRILEGQTLADVAAELGFADQAHMTRRFRKFLGTTPGRYARGRRHR